MCSTKYYISSLPSGCSVISALTQMFLKTQKKYISFPSLFFQGKKHVSVCKLYANA